jgi:small subunit ribosomal protein S20
VANTAQARKRVRQNVKHRKHNASQRSMMRTYVKKVKTAIEGAEKATANEALKIASSVLDKMVSKGIIHKNKAARCKHRLNAKVKSL